MYNGKAVALCWHCLLQFALAVWQLLCPAYSHGKNIWSAFKLQRNYVSISLSHCGRKLRIICRLLLHLFCVPTLRFSQLCDYHVMDTVYPPFPLSRLFSHAPYPNRQKCLAFSEHLTLSVTVQATNERILQRSCCEKLMITYLVYIPYPPPASKHLNKTKERNK